MPIFEDRSKQNYLIKAEYYLKLTIMNQKKKIILILHIKHSTRTKTKLYTRMKTFISSKEQKKAWTEKQRKSRSYCIDDRPTNKVDNILDVLE